MAYRKKADVILKHKPDILVVPECEHPDKLKFNAGTPEPTSILWFGNNHNKGLGIFSYSDFKLKVHKAHNEDLKLIVPFSATKGNLKFTLFAIRANNPKDPDGPYVEQIWKAIKLYNKLFKKTHTILIGDFNSNTIWDKPRREGNHSTVVQQLEKKGIHSVYHGYFKQAQGKEQHPTLYMYKHKDKCYHIDYCFASEDLISKLQHVEIGDYDSWTKYSDHVPVIVTFNV
jgi:exodeoxyribonuclease-3